MKHTILAALAVVALGLGACTGPAAAPKSNSPTASDTAEPAAASPSPAADSAAPPAGQQSPGDASKADEEEFKKRYEQAVKSIKTVTFTTTGIRGRGKTVVDRSDPGRTRSYAVLDFRGQKVEAVIDGPNVWTRQGGAGKWNKADDSPQPVRESNKIPQIPASARVRLLDRKERKYEVTSTASSTLWVDEQFRPVKWAVALGSDTLVTTYSRFNEPVEIPKVA